MFEIYYMGKSFPTAPPWKKNQQLFCKVKDKKGIKKMDSLLYRHKSGIDMSM